MTGAPPAQDVFVSYKREDAQRVARLVLALRAQDLAVWWDHDLPAGESWRGQIEQVLAASRCAIVVWTETSVGAAGAFVKDEAGRAAAAGRLVPVLMDRVVPPLGFGEWQAVDLTRWSGSPRDPFFQDLIAAVRAKIEGRPVPPPRGPLARLRHRLGLGTLLSGLAVAAAGFATNALGLQDRACALPLVQPLVSDSCAALGLGHRPLKTERLAWEQRPAGDCEALREHLRRHPQGAFQQDAQRLLQARVLSDTERWVNSQRALSLYVGAGDAAPAASEIAARERTLSDARQDAARLCRDFQASGLFHFLSAEVQPENWDCKRGAAGWACAMAGRSLCRLEERQALQVERCDARPSTSTP